MRGRIEDDRQLELPLPPVRPRPLPEKSPIKNLPLSYGDLS